MRVQVHYRYLLLLASFVALVLLRSRPLLMGLYVGAVVVLAAVWVLWLPRQVTRAERRFEREALRLLAGQDLQRLQALAARQWLIQRLGAKHVLPGTLALGAAAAGDHEAARDLYQEALRHAPPQERTRLEINLAGEELLTGQLEAADRRFRGILRKRPDLNLARISLARALVWKIAQGDDRPPAEERADAKEALTLLQAALDRADPRETVEIHLLQAEALIRIGRDGAEAIGQAREAGAGAEAIARLEALEGAAGVA